MFVARLIQFRRLLVSVNRGTASLLDTWYFFLYIVPMNTQTPLPQSEIEFLAALSASDQSAFHARLRVLWEAGWSLSVLGNSVSPKRPRATIHYWVRRADQPRGKVLEQVPQPQFNKSLTSVLVSEAKGTTRTISPTVTPETAARLRSLSLQARRYRSRTASDNRFAVANQEFTALCKQLRAEGVPAADIASAAGISYRAVARRVAK